MVGQTDEKVADLKEGHFDVLINAANDVMIAFARIDEDENDPVFVYDGKSRAFLFKNANGPSSRVFTNLPSEAREPLNAATEILCVEIDREHIFKEYMARVEVRR